jgi:FixJ family two-component response regulator
MKHDRKAEVIIIDDDVYIQRALKRLLSTRGFSTRIFSSPREFFENQYLIPHIGCLVLDIEMPGINGLELQAQLNRRNILLPVVFLTGHGTIPRSVQAMKQGAMDFLEKPVDGYVLIDAIERAISRSQRQFEEKQVCLDLEQRFSALSPREREVFGFIVQGVLNKQIAIELGIVEQTVKVHRMRIMEKMRASSLAELVSMAEKLRMPPCSFPFLPPSK